MTGPTQSRVLVGTMTQCEISARPARSWSCPLIQLVVDRAGDGVGYEAEHERAAEDDRELARAAEGEHEREHDERVEQSARVRRVAQQLEQHAHDDRAHDDAGMLPWPPRITIV